MRPLEIKKGIYWVGAVDWNVRTFHGHTYTTNRGTTYNAYLIIDDKIALVDAVYRPFAYELIEKIKQIVPAEKIDYIIANHVEPDHSGALPELMKVCPRAKVFGTVCRHDESIAERKWSVKPHFLPPHGLQKRRKKRGTKKNLSRVAGARTRRGVVRDHVGHDHVTQRQERRAGGDVDDRGDLGRAVDRP